MLRVWRETNRGRLSATALGLALATAGGCASILGAPDVPPAPASDGDSGPLNPADAGLDTSAVGFDSGAGSADADLESSDSFPDDAPPLRDAAATSPDAADGGGDGGADAGDAGIDAGPPCAAAVLYPIGATASPNAKQSATNAIDGDFTTRWESAWQIDPQWIFVDFGAPVHIGEVKVLWESAYAVDYQIQVSNDAIAWTTVATVVGNTQYSQAPTDYSGAVDTTGLSVAATYVRVYGTIRHDASYGYSIWEIQTIGDTNSACNPQ